MSNLISELPINKFYSPTPIEINTFNTLIPEEKIIDSTLSYKDYLIISSISSLLITLVMYLFIYFSKHTVTKKFLLLFFFIIFIINYSSNIVSKQILSLIS